MREKTLILGLPRRDVAMNAILIAAMLLIDGAALASGLSRWAGPFLIIMPGTLALIWTCYIAAMAWISRKADDRAARKAAGFMGLTLSAIGGVMAIAHAGLIGVSAGWIGSAGVETVMRAFGVGLCLVLVAMHNFIPKFVASSVSTVLARGSRLAGWVGVLCSLAMMAVVLLLPLGQMLPYFLVLALLPTAITLGNTLIWWLDRRRAERA